MTGATDGDVDRALAAMGATPLKYHSFGGVSVRPPGSEPGIGGTDNRTADPRGVPPTGEGTVERYRAHAAATVFPLLGLALPEAFQIDVEPVWPVGPPVSDQGILLDRSVGFPPNGYGNNGRAEPGLSPGYGGVAPGSFSDPNYAPPASSFNESGGAALPSFAMPPWLDPLPSANPLHDLPDVPPAAAYPQPESNYGLPSWHSAASDPRSVSEPSAPPPDMFPVRRLNTWGEAFGGEAFGGESFGGETSRSEPLAGETEGRGSYDDPSAQHGAFNPFSHTLPPSSPGASPGWLEQTSSDRETPPLVPDWTAHVSSKPASEVENLDQHPRLEPNLHERHYPLPEDVPPALNLVQEDKLPEASFAQQPDLWVQHSQPIAPSPKDHKPTFEQAPQDDVLGRSHWNEGARSSLDRPADLHAQDPLGHYSAVSPDELPVAFTPSRFQSIDSEPTWHEPPQPGTAGATTPGWGSGFDHGGESQASSHKRDEAGINSPSPVGYPLKEIRESTDPAGVPAAIHRRPLADMFRTLGGGSPGKGSGG